MTRANETLLDELHAMTGATFLSEIKRYKEGLVLDKDGNPLPVPAALLTSAAKFLKDNGVDRAVKPGDPEDLLADELPDYPDNTIPFPQRA